MLRNLPTGFVEILGNDPDVAFMTLNEMLSTDLMFNLVRWFEDTGMHTCAETVLKYNFETLEEVSNTYSIGYKSSLYSQINWFNVVTTQTFEKWLESDKTLWIHRWKERQPIVNNFDQWTKLSQSTTELSAESAYEFLNKAIEKRWKQQKRNPKEEIDTNTEGYEEDNEKIERIRDEEDLEFLSKKNRFRAFSSLFTSLFDQHKDQWPSFLVPLLDRETLFDPLETDEEGNVEKQSRVYQASAKADIEGTFWSPFVHDFDAEDVDNPLQKYFRDMIPVEGVVKIETPKSSVENRPTTFVVFSDTPSVWENNQETMELASHYAHVMKREENGPSQVDLKRTSDSFDEQPENEELSQLLSSYTATMIGQTRIQWIAKERIAVQMGLAAVGGEGNDNYLNVPDFDDHKPTYTDRRWVDDSNYQLVFLESLFPQPIIELRNAFLTDTPSPVPSDYLPQPDKVDFLMRNYALLSNWSSFMSSSRQTILSNWLEQTVNFMILNFIESRMCDLWEESLGLELNMNDLEKIKASTRWNDFVANSYECLSDCLIRYKQPESQTDYKNTWMNNIASFFRTESMPIFRQEVSIYLLWWLQAEFDMNRLNYFLYKQGLTSDDKDIDDPNNVDEDGNPYVVRADYWVQDAKKLRDMTDDLIKSMSGVMITSNHLVEVILDFLRYAFAVTSDAANNKSASLAARSLISSTKWLRRFIDYKVEMTLKNTAVEVSLINSSTSTDFYTQEKSWSEFFSKVQLNLMCYNNMQEQLKEYETRTTEREFDDNWKLILSTIETIVNQVIKWTFEDPINIIKLQATGNDLVTSMRKLSESIIKFYDQKESQIKINRYLLFIERSIMSDFRVSSDSEENDDLVRELIVPMDFSDFIIQSSVHERIFCAIEQQLLDGFVDIRKTLMGLKAAEFAEPEHVKLQDGCLSWWTLQYFEQAMKFEKKTTEGQLKLRRQRDFYKSEGKSKAFDKNRTRLSKMIDKCKMNESDILYNRPWPCNLRFEMNRHRDLYMPHDEQNVRSLLPYNAVSIKNRYDLVRKMFRPEQNLYYLKKDFPIESMLLYGSLKFGFLEEQQPVSIIIPTGNKNKKKTKEVVINSDDPSNWLFEPFALLQQQYMERLDSLRLCSDLSRILDSKSRWQWNGLYGFQCNSNLSLPHGTESMRVIWTVNERPIMEEYVHVNPSMHLSQPLEWYSFNLNVESNASSGLNLVKRIDYMRNGHKANQMSIALLGDSNSLVINTLDIKYTVHCYGRILQRLKKMGLKGIETNLDFKSFRKYFADDMFLPLISGSATVAFPNPYIHKSLDSRISKRNSLYNDRDRKHIPDRCKPFKQKLKTLYEPFKDDVELYRDFCFMSLRQFMKRHPDYQVDYYYLARNKYPVFADGSDYATAEEFERTIEQFDRKFEEVIAINPVEDDYQLVLTFV